jgi:hypothetical protein
MKLVEIKDVRENQVWISDNDERKYLVIENDDNDDYLFFKKFFKLEGEDIIQIGDYLGTLGVTHEFVNNKL